MNDIQDEAYSEAMDEIARLEQLNDNLIADKNRIIEVAKKALTEKDAEIEAITKAHAVSLKTQLVLTSEIERLRKVITYYKSRKLESLLTRSADALETGLVLLNDQDRDEIIDELREAAK